jgi:hypothetical protein
MAARATALSLHPSRRRRWRHTRSNCSVRWIGACGHSGDDRRCCGGGGRRLEGSAQWLDNGTWRRRWLRAARPVREKRAMCGGTACSVVGDTISWRHGPSDHPASYGPGRPKPRLLLGGGAARHRAGRGWLAATLHAWVDRRRAAGAMPARMAHAAVRAHIISQRLLSVARP